MNETFAGERPMRIKGVTIGSSLEEYYTIQC